MYFDTHAHYFDDRFKNELPNDVNDLLLKLFSENVEGIVNIGTSPETSIQALQMAEKYENMYAAVGIHPTDAQMLQIPLDEALNEIEKMILSHNKKIVAIGEIGLDYHYEDTDKKLQREALIKQLDMAVRHKIPFVIHDRDAHGDIFDILHEYRGNPGIIHSYSGSAEMAKEFVKDGYMISFSGTVTFTNARKVFEAASVVPLDRLLIETDCPYLAPHPFRGKLNHSGYLAYTNAKLAEAKGISNEEMADITLHNAKRFFEIT